jgi:hypothetical protein
MTTHLIATFLSLLVQQRHRTSGRVLPSERRVYRSLDDATGNAAGRAGGNTPDRRRRKVAAYLILVACWWKSPLLKCNHFVMGKQ